MQVGPWLRLRALLALAVSVGCVRADASGRGSAEGGPRKCERRLVADAARRGEAPTAADATCRGSATAEAAACAPDDACAEGAEAAANVILVTLDGVRWQELYGRPDPALGGADREVVFLRLWSSLAAEGAVLDGEIANPFHVSLPAYQSIFAGQTQPCDGNACGRVGVATFPERIAGERGLPPAKVASFASWSRLADAVASRSGATFVSAGAERASASADADLARIEAEQEPYIGEPARPDRVTMALALHHLERHRPAFLFVGLNDADEDGHAGRYDRYLASLRADDAWIADLAASLDRMGEYGRRTALIVTTDHGRGAGARWTDHGVTAVGDADRRIWMYVRLPRDGRFTLALPARRVTHLDVRPTVEVLLGLAPEQREGGGASLVTRR